MALTKIPTPPAGTAYLMVWRLNRNYGGCPAGSTGGQDIPNQTSMLQSLKQFEAELGRSVDAWHFYKQWSWVPFQSGSDEKAIDAEPRIDSRTLSGGANRYLWFNINSPDDWATIAAMGATVQTRVDAMFTGLKNYGKPCVFAWNGEPEPDTGATKKGTAAQFAAAFRAIALRRNAVGADNVMMSWNMIGASFDTNGGAKATGYWPGADVVDLISPDGYNWSERDGGNYRTFQQVFDGCASWTQAHAPSTPIWPGEFNTMEDKLNLSSGANAKGDWYSAIPGAIKNYAGFNGTNARMIGIGLFDSLPSKEGWVWYADSVFTQASHIATPASICNLHFSSAGHSWQGAKTAFNDPVFLPGSVISPPGGSTIPDDTGNGHDGTTTNFDATPATMTGPSGHGQALKFDGTRLQLLEIPNDPALQFTGAFTLMAWAWLDNTVDTDPSHQRYEIMEKAGSYWLNVREDSSPLYKVRTGGFFGANATFNEADSATSVTPKTWTHIAATYDGANLRIYLNAVLDKTQAQSGAIAVSSEKLVIGGKHRAITLPELKEAYWNGGLDDVQVYDVALTQAQIATAMATQVVHRVPTTNTITHFGAGEPELASGVYATADLQYRIDAVSDVFGQNGYLRSAFNPQSVAANVSYSDSDFLPWDELANMVSAAHLRLWPSLSPPKGVVPPITMSGGVETMVEWRAYVKAFCDRFAARTSSYQTPITHFEATDWQPVQTIELIANPNAGGAAGSAQYPKVTVDGAQATAPHVIYLLVTESVSEIRAHASANGWTPYIVGPSLADMPPNYLTQILAEFTARGTSLQAWVDAVGIHVYPFEDPTLGAGSQARYATVGNVRAILDTAGATATEIAICETGYSGHDTTNRYTTPAGPPNVIYETAHAGAGDQATWAGAGVDYLQKKNTDSGWKVRSYLWYSIVDTNGVAYTAAAGSNQYTFYRDNLGFVNGSSVYDPTLRKGAATSVASRILGYNNPPVVYIDGPIPGTTNTGTDLPLQIRVEDPDGDNLTLVQYSVNGGAWTSLGEAGVQADGTTLYTGTATITTDVAPGVANTIIFRARDITGLETVTGSITVYGITTGSFDDVDPPILTIISPADRSTIVGGNGTAQLVTGTAVDALSGVAAVHINGQAVPIGAGGSFSGSVILQTGANVLTVDAVDASPNANRASQTLTVTLTDEPGVDLTPPDVRMFSPNTDLTVQGLDGTTFVVAGVAVDDSGISAVTINGTATAISTDESFSLPIVLALGANDVVIAVTDASPQRNQTVIEHTITLVVPDLVDVTPPTLVLRHPAGNVIVSGSGGDLYFVQGNALDASGIQSVVLNGALVSTDGAGNFSQQIVLEQGQNPITVVATDASPAHNQASVSANINLQTSSGGGGGGTVFVQVDLDKIINRIHERGLQ